MKETDETYTGTREEIARLLKMEIAENRTHMLACLNAALDTMELMMSLESEPGPNGEDGVYMEPIFEHLEKTFGMPISQEQQLTLAFIIETELTRWHGVSMCMMWQWAHAIEHATMRNKGTVN